MKNASQNARHFFLGVQKLVIKISKNSIAWNSITISKNCIR